MSTVQSKLGRRVQQLGLQSAPRVCLNSSETIKEETSAHQRKRRQTRWEGRGVRCLWPHWKDDPLFYLAPLNLQ